MAKSLDDYEGNLTREGIKNFLGIVKFEINIDFTLNTEEPDKNWKEIQPLAETTTVTERTEEGRKGRLLYHYIHLYWILFIEYMTYNTISTVRRERHNYQKFHSSQTKKALKQNWII